MKKSSHFHLAEADLLCKNRCGFYGNTLFNGYCSVCYKHLSGRQRLHSTGSDTVQNTKQVPQQQGERQSSSQNFAKFEEKRKVQSERKSMTVKSLFRKTPTKQEKIAATGLT